MEHLGYTSVMLFPIKTPSFFLRGFSQPCFFHDTKEATPTFFLAQFKVGSLVPQGLNDRMNGGTA
jgi:hypothetical protein